MFGAVTAGFLTVARFAGFLTYIAEAELELYSVREKHRSEQEAGRQSPNNKLGYHLMLDLPSDRNVERPVRCL